MPTILSALLTQRQELKAYKGLPSPKAKRLFKEAKAILEGYIWVEQHHPNYLGDDEILEVQSYLDDLEMGRY